MDLLENSRLRSAIEAGKIEWPQHILERLIIRGISREAVLEVLLRGHRIEYYPNDFPWPSALFHAVIEQRPIHVVAASSPKTGTIAVVTAYEPDLDHFEIDYITRKKK